MFGLQSGLPFSGETWDKIRAMDLKGRLAAIRTKKLAKINKKLQGVKNFPTI
ncbi:MAG: hypothetical protein Ct9H300mP3_00810 [Gammaproteobacteria bacterium]|nr:MAG: hypothetical protein Ct9H300mP3_00810 [Gammaproteobacteria bacterium]